MIIEDEDRKTHCKKCEEWLEEANMCPECGMINTKIRSEKDALILYNKAINLMEKIHGLPYYFHNWISEVDRNIHGAELFKSRLIEEFTEVHPDLNKSFDDIIDMLKRFKNQYLSETEQKTKKPRNHENL